MIYLKKEYLYYSHLYLDHLVLKIPNKCLSTINWTDVGTGAVDETRDDTWKNAINSIWRDSKKYKYAGITRC